MRYFVKFFNLDYAQFDGFYIQVDVGEKSNNEG